MRLLLVSVLLIFCNLVLKVPAIETPPYSVVQSKLEFEIRLYKESTWVSAKVRDNSFEKSTTAGFHRLYEYIHGANLNSSRITMTAPVLTSMETGKDGYSHIVRVYLSPKHEKATPEPKPELNLQIEKWKSHCIAIRKFPGFAKDDNVHKEVEALVTSLNKPFSGKTLIQKDKTPFTIAQYNAPFRQTARINEVWINVSGFTVEGCPSYEGN